MTAGRGVEVLASVARNGFEFGLLVTAFWFGFRHGIDWDHIAAITDITSSQDERRRAMLFGTLYALGHALVVFVIGVLAIVAGQNLPDSVDNIMTRIVGGTLLLLGVYVVVSLVRHGRDFRLRSRWMLFFSGVRKGARWVRSRLGVGAASRSRRTQELVSVGAPGGPAGEGSEEIDASTWHHGHHGRPGHHHHARPEPDDTFMNYGRLTAFSVGMIHGVGGETPTQVILFSTAAGVRNASSGLLVLAAFLVGLFSSNSLITLGSAFGYLQATRNFWIYATVAILTAAFSLVIGTIFILGKTTVLPALGG
jgi:high-affinity nickel permease